MGNQKISQHQHQVFTKSTMLLFIHVSDACERNIMNLPCHLTQYFSSYIKYLLTHRDEIGNRDLRTGLPWWCTDCNMLTCSKWIYVWYCTNDVHISFWARQGPLSSAGNQKKWLSESIVPDDWGWCYLQLLLRFDF